MTHNQSTLFTPSRENGNFVALPVTGRGVVYANLSTGATVTIHQAEITDQSLSSDGKRLAYDTYNALAGTGQVYLRNFSTSLPFSLDAIVSSAADGTPGNGDSRLVALSGDGRHAAFVWLQD